MPVVNYNKINGKIPACYLFRVSRGFSGAGMGFSRNWSPRALETSYAQIEGHPQ